MRAVNFLGRPRLKQKNYTLEQAFLIHLIFAIVKIGMILLPVVDIFFEEAQYWLWSRFPDWSYYSKPPLVAYVNMFSSYLFGINHLGIRINAVVCGFLIGIILYKLAEDIFKDRKIAFFSSVSLLAFPYFWIISFFFTTDSLLTLFWVLATWLGWRSLNGYRGYQWWTAIAVGLGILSKFTMLVFWPLFLIYLAVHQKKAIRSYYLPILLSFVFFLPILIWNHQHDWITLRHLAGTSGNHGFSMLKSAKHLGEFLAGQFLLFALFFPVVFFRTCRDFFSGHQKAENYYLFLPLILTIFFFIGLSLITRTEANWTFYVMPAFSVIVGKALADKRKSLYIRTSVASGIMILFFCLPMLSVPMNLPSKQNPFKRLMGWRNIADQVQEVIDRDKDPESNYHIITDSYQWSSLLSFYLRDHPLSYVLECDRRMNQLDLWRPHLKMGKNDRYILFMDNAEGMHPFIEGRFEDPRDSVNIQYPLNKTDSLHYEVIVYGKFKGFSGRDFTSY